MSSTFTGSLWDYPAKIRIGLNNRWEAVVNYSR
jgi:hypothetical protein